MNCKWQIMGKTRQSRSSSQNNKTKGSQESHDDWDESTFVQDAQDIIIKDEGEALVELLERKKVSVNALYSDLNGRSLLHHACERDAMNCCRSLTAFKADPNIWGTNAQKYCM